MPIFTETQLRSRIRQPQQGMKLTLPKDARLSPSAQDFINHWKIEVTFTEGEEVEVEEVSPTAGRGERPAWDKPGTFPVVLVGDIPRCTTCGMPVKPKPDHMTQLDATHFAPKNIPRIRFRGKMDTLHALCLLICARTAKLPQLAERLSTLAAYCREIASAEYGRRPVAPLSLDGLSDDELRKATHQPEEHFGISHIVPGPEDPEILHWLNLLRCQVREVELSGLDAFVPLGSEPSDEGLVRALNRLSNAVYYLELMFAAGKLG